MRKTRAGTQARKASMVAKPFMRTVEPLAVLTRLPTGRKAIRRIRLKKRNMAPNDWWDRGIVN